MLDEYPEILKNNIDIAEPNGAIPIHKGEFNVVFGDLILTLDGVIRFTWFPQNGVKFKGEIVAGLSSIGQLKDLQNVDVILDAMSIGKFNLTNFSVSTEGSLPSLRGSASGVCVVGDKTISADKVTFVVPNLREFLGDSVRDGTAVMRGRLEFENDDYLILLDKKRDYKEVGQKLEQTGGYAILYFGEITKKKDSGISLADIQQLAHQLQIFLTFLNGRRCSPLFFQGWYEQKVIWTDYSSDSVDPYASVLSWPDNHSIDGLAEIWKSFSVLWKNEHSKDFLNTAIHWYVSANGNEGLGEGSIIMVQTALELFYNWHLIEGKKLLSGKDAENISASNKIRLVLADLGVSKAFPAMCVNLKELKLDDGRKHLSRYAMFIPSMKNERN